MLRKCIAAGLILFGTLTAQFAYAEDTTNPSSSSDSNVMTKDAWLNLMTPMLPDLICKGFIQDEELKKRFDELKMTYEQCLAFIPESTKKCQDELYSSMPDNVNQETAGTWGRSLGECIGKDFAEKHLIPKG